MARTAFQHAVPDTPYEAGRELRAFPRAQICLLGRFMLSDRLEFPCQTRNLSPGGALLYTPIQGQEGERVVLYLDQIGRLEGAIVRGFRSGFALEFKISQAKRDKFAEQIDWLTTQATLGLRDREMRLPHMPRDFSQVRLLTGEEFQVEVLDVSLSGVAIALDATLPLGARIVVGKTPGRVVRNFEGGVAVEFRGIVSRGPDGAIDF